MGHKKVAIIGECMVELSKSDAGLQYGFGGDTLNTAVYLSRLTHSFGVEVSYLTGLGKDPFSREMMDKWQAESINTDRVAISDTKLPGIYAIETSEDGERSFYYWRQDSAAKYWLREYTSESLAELLTPFEVIYLSGISLAILPTDCRDKLIQALGICKQHGTQIVFDNNYRPRLWESPEVAQKVYRSVLSLTDIAFLTFDDEVLLYGDTEEKQCMERTQSLGVKEIVIKRGAEDCYLVSGDEFVSVAANKVSHVIDTTAAGDSFSAGYMAKRLLGGSLSESATLGHGLASEVIQHRGAIIPESAMPEM